MEYWKQVINELYKRGHDVWQIGRKGEEKLAEQAKADLSYADLKEFCSDMDKFISVDNFFPHFCNHYNLKSGVVIFSKSDPAIFGYPQNINVLRNRKYLRPDQFGLWDSCDYDKESFVSPEFIINQI